MEGVARKKRDRFKDSAGCDKRKPHTKKKKGWTATTPVRLLYPLQLESSFPTPAPPLSPPSRTPGPYLCDDHGRFRPAPNFLRRRSITKQTVTRVLCCRGQITNLYPHHLGLDVVKLQLALVRRLKVDSHAHQSRLDGLLLVRFRFQHMERNGTQKENQTMY